MKFLQTPSVALLAVAWLALPVISAAFAGDPPVYSEYNSYQVRGFNRSSGNAHPAIDYGAAHGAPVIASATGEVVRDFVSARYGNRVIIRHSNGPGDGRPIFTVYLHLSRVLVKNGDWVNRGDEIGKNGSSGNASWEWPHVHFELSKVPRVHRDGDLATTLNPGKFMVGCFDPKVEYPKDRFVLTYPLACKSHKGVERKDTDAERPSKSAVDSAYDRNMR